MTVKITPRMFHARLSEEDTELIAEMIECGRQAEHGTGNREFTDDEEYCLRWFSNLLRALYLGPGRKTAK